MTSDELFASGEFSSQRVQHSPKFADQFECGIRGRGRAELQLNAQNKLRVQLSHATLPRVK